MELGGKLLNSLRIKILFLERLQSVSVVDGATHTQKDDVEGNKGYLENTSKPAFVMAYCFRKEKKNYAGSENNSPH